MSLACPACRKALRWWDLRRSFSCRACHRRLTARVSGPLIATIVLWSVAELPLFIVLPPREGSVGILVAVLRSLLSLGIGYAIGSYVFMSVGVVEEGADSRD
jgi:hypothetical protein